MELENARAIYLAENFERAAGAEVEERRDRFTKHYDLGGGRFQAVTYARPVHYRDGDGTWAEIDARLEPDESGARFRTRAGEATISVARDADADALVKIEHKGRTLSWQFEKAAKDVAPDVVADNNLALTAARMASTETAQDARIREGVKSSRVTYAEIADGVSAVYDIEGSCVKENIIVGGADALSNAALLLPDTYDYAVMEDQSVQVLDKADGAALFRFASPVVWDSADEIRKDGAAVRLTPLSGYVRLEYVLGEEFLKEAVYPITIDPVVEFILSDTSVQDTYIWEANKSTNYGGVYMMRCGEGSGGESIGLVKFNKLVRQRASDTIIYAGLRLFPDNYQSATEYMAVYPLNHPFGEYKATWNKPAVDANGNAVTMDLSDFIGSDILDYVTTTNVTSQLFDITNIYRTWYQKDSGGNSRNFGIAIRYPSGTSTSKYVEYSASTYSPSVAPQMVVNYVSHAGRAGWWQYEDQGIGRGGTASVDIYNGNLVYRHQDTAMNGNLMPVSVTHTYNSCLSSGNEVGCGMGWRTSAHQSVYLKTVSGQSFYVWTDGGGTEHWFKISGSQPYADDQGMKLKLRTSGTTLTIEDKGNNVMTFTKPTSTAKNYVDQVKDACGNTAAYVYASGLLKSVKDGAGRTTTFNYSGGLLSNITAPGCPVVNFTYTGSLLTGITYGDITGGTVIAYESGTNMLVSATNFDGVGVSVTYAAAGSFDAACIDDYAAQQRRVTSMELKNGATRGAKRLFEYGGCVTKVTSVTGTSSDAGKALTYQFNDAGNVVCVMDELGFAQFTEFSNAAGQENTPTAGSVLRKAVINKVPNIGFSGSEWAETLNGGSIDQVTNVTCLSMSSSKFVVAASGEMVSSISVPLQQSGPYTFSAYVKTTGVTGNGAFLRVVANGTTYESRKVTTSTADMSGGPAADGWDRPSITFDFTYGSATSVTAALVVSGSAGTVYFSCPQLEEGVIANRPNLLRNADFTRITTNNDGTTARKFPKSWTASSGITTSTKNGILTSGHGMPAALRGNALREVSAPTRDAVSFVQDVPVYGSSGDVFVVGGWLNSHSVAHGGANNAPGVAYRFRKSDGSTWDSWRYLEANREWVGWQFACWAIKAPLNYTFMQYSLHYARNNSTCMFSNMFLHREQFGNTFVYDADKNVVSASTRAGEKSNLEYDSFDNLTSYVRPGAATTDKFLVTYGSTDDDRKKHLVRTSATPKGVKAEYTYDTKGNLTKALNRKTSTESVIGAKTGYSSSMNYATSSTDARGYAVTKSVNETTGLTASVTDPAGAAVGYTYDNSKRVTGVSCATGGKTYKNAYTYQNDRLKTVSHNTTSDTATDVTYTFGYDALGRKTTVQVGSQTLSTNVYATDRSSLLKEVQYGNGGKTKYAYDEFDRLTKIAYDSANVDTVPRFTHEYGANGKVARVTDNQLKYVVSYEYDLAERPLQTDMRYTNGTPMYRTTLKYDKLNQLKSLTEILGTSSKYVTTYGYDEDGRTTQTAFGDTTHKVDYVYDSNGRTRTRTVTNGSNTYASTYSYTAGSTSLYGSAATSSLISGIGQAGIAFAYTYDSRGNIVSEKRGTPTTTYAYDGMGQLTRVNDPNDKTACSNGTTWVYAYDRGGNMTSATRYEYTTGTPSASPVITTYAYGDSNWKDKLTAINTQTVQYDTMGNMTNDGTHANTWEHGRQLKQTVKGAKTVGYLYCFGGTRTHKNVTESGVTTTTYYRYNGNLLTNCSRSSYGQHFFYDAQGRPAMVKFTSSGTAAYYAYVYNLQGDVVGLLDSANNLVVEYRYDAWGKPLSTTGTLAGTLGKENPFRYRGYLYDEETGYYYLRSRYYDPGLRRFINADSILGQLGKQLAHNLYTYCYNNPIILSDTSGSVPSYSTYETDTGGSGYHSPGWSDYMANPTKWDEQSPRNKLKKWTNWIGQEILEAYRAGTQGDIISAQLQAVAAENLVNNTKKLAEQTASKIHDVMDWKITKIFKGMAGFVWGVYKGIQSTIIATAAVATPFPGISEAAALGFAAKAGYHFGNARKNLEDVLNILFFNK